MAGRRRETRFLPSTPWSAALQTVEDVVLERSEGGEIWVVGETPARRGDDLILEVATGGLRLGVHVLHSEPVLLDGAIRHRLRLQVTDPDAADDADVIETSNRAGGIYGVEIGSRH